MSMLRFHGLNSEKQKAVYVFLALVSLSATLTGTFLLPERFPDLRFLFAKPLTMVISTLTVLTIIFLFGVFKAGLLIIPPVLFSFEAAVSSAMASAFGAGGAFTAQGGLTFVLIPAAAVTASLLLSFRGIAVAGSYSLTKSRNSRFARTQRKLFFAEYAALSFILLLICFFIYFTA